MKIFRRTIHGNNQGVIYIENMPFSKKLANGTKDVQMVGIFTRSKFSECFIGLSHMKARRLAEALLEAVNKEEGT